MIHNKWNNPKKNTRTNQDVKVNRQNLHVSPEETTSQSATWIDARDKLPQYYDNVIIDTGKETLRGWARVSNGERDYYVPSGDSDDNRVINHIKRWKPIPNETLDMYRPWCGYTENMPTGFTSNVMFSIDPEDNQEDNQEDDEDDQDY